MIFLVYIIARSSYSTHVETVDNILLILIFTFMSHIHESLLSSQFLYSYLTPVYPSIYSPSVSNHPSRAKHTIPLLY